MLYSFVLNRFTVLVIFNFLILHFLNKKIRTSLGFLCIYWVNALLLLPAIWIFNKIIRVSDANDFPYIVVYSIYLSVWGLLCGSLHFLNKIKSRPSAKIFNEE